MTFFVFQCYIFFTPCVLESPARVGVFPEGGEMKKVEVDVGEALRGFLHSLAEAGLCDGEPTLVVLRLPEEATGDEPKATVEAQEH